MNNDGREINPHSAMDHCILFCEPFSLKSGEGLPVSMISKEFYQTILAGPKVYSKKAGNAYLFGKLFAVGSYKKIGSHYNDAAQTGFLDVDLLPGNLSEIEDVIRPFYLGKDFKHWDDRPTLEALRKEAPYILFLGETAGGDVGADLYAHTTDGIIDSLIINVGYFGELR
ncbi:hypothetical protein BNJ_00282 [Kaumoebavirus]|uniref:hypothetical protein n=1 Tax=Kaumoebavirus TaxID=1859492 RepID=UPI0009C32ABA|nr:hypothetical protein BNJ_00282 [Kaumoebavirus]ARA72105.1 hypothetical protein BNJ_00282 [Kaumoebavirus]